RWSSADLNCTMECIARPPEDRVTATWSRLPSGADPLSVVPVVVLFEPSPWCLRSAAATAPILKCGISTQPVVRWPALLLRGYVVFDLARLRLQEGRSSDLRRKRRSNRNARLTAPRIRVETQGSVADTDCRKGPRASASALLGP